MTLVRWRPRRELNPFAVMEHLQDHINRAFNFSLPSPTGLGGSFPAVDVRQDKENVIVVAEVPGLAAEDIDLSITGNTITLKGEKKPETEAEDDYAHLERSYGSFERVIELPVEVAAGKAKATLLNGVLSLTLPKSEAVKPKRIEIT